MGGAWVFPGGAVHEGETEVETAVREAEEEAALKLDTGTLVPFSRWITPAQVKVRFDTHFFVAPAPDDADRAATARSASTFAGSDRPRRSRPASRTSSRWSSPRSSTWSSSPSSDRSKKCSSTPARGGCSPSSRACSSTGASRRCSCRASPATTTPSRSLRRPCPSAFSSGSSSPCLRRSRRWSASSSSTAARSSLRGRGTASRQDVARAVPVELVHDRHPDCDGLVGLPRRGAGARPDLARAVGDRRRARAADGRRRPPVRPTR